MRIEFANMQRAVEELRRGLPDEHAAAHAATARALEVLTEERRRTPMPFSWGDLRPADHANRRGDINRWITETFHDETPDTAKLVKPCWWEHPDVRTHLTAVWLAWIGAYRATGRKHDAPAIYLEQRLPRLRHMLRTYLGDETEPCTIHPVWPPPDPQRPPD